MDSSTYRAARWAALAVCLAVCLLAYLRVIPLAVGMAASCGVPLIWAVDAYRSQKRLMFVAAATLLMLTALPLLRLARHAGGF
ncbi:hypothetical protein [Lichenibacterium ramalinae]|uniref:Uncharacterized protein n=1 Tax=Lichenibacterium ramalinae TaxID=2316527 RepID=A0A4Q2RKU2_9HYPH|nr:hypothetical protein [Lichenibacterium ramalinae]RYB07903.1 hypothetical protein D3272_01955 [Lichenibacterium ramalinae]